jgi:hypothetical protein
MVTEAIAVTRGRSSDVVRRDVADAGMVDLAQDRDREQLIVTNRDRLRPWAPDAFARAYGNPDAQTQNGAWKAPFCKKPARNQYRLPVPVSLS